MSKKIDIVVDVETLGCYAASDCFFETLILWECRKKLEGMQ